MDTKVNSNSILSNDSLAILTNGGSESATIKKYFEVVFRLYKSGEMFPVDLDEVWPLVYSRKDNAVRMLIDSGEFMEGVDYQVFRRNAENSSKVGRSANGYMITVKCMEFLVARKERKIFDIYRQVFEDTVNKKSSTNPTLDEILRGTKFVLEELNISDVGRLNAYKSIMSPLGVRLPEYIENTKAHFSASDLISKRNLQIKITDFNKLLEEKGFIRKLERRSTKSPDKVKRYWNVTEKGLGFGINVTSPKNPNETQPHWYEHKFDELLSVLGL